MSCFLIIFIIYLFHIESVTYYSKSETVYHNGIAVTLPPPTSKDQSVNPSLTSYGKAGKLVCRWVAFSSTEP